MADPAAAKNPGAAPRRPDFSTGPSRRFAQNRDSFRILLVFKALQGGKFPSRSRRRRTAAVDRDRDRCGRRPSRTVSRPDRWGTRTARRALLIRAARSAGPCRELAQNRDFLPHFASFQGLARRKISHAV